MKSTRILLSGFTALALLTGCGGSSMADMTDMADSAVDAAKDAVGFNDSDLNFT